MTDRPNGLIRKARRLRSINAQIKDLYALRDELEGQIIKALPVGESLDIGRGFQVESVDNFASKNIVFGHGPVRRFEAKISKLKTAVKPMEPAT